MKSAALISAGAAMPFHATQRETRSGNLFPGRIVIWEDLEATNGNGINDIDFAVVQQMFDDSITALTGVPDPVPALESLLPGLNTSKRVAIKVNCINNLTPTRWEVVKAITDRLCGTLGGTFPPGNITIFDDNGLHSGYNTTNFPGIVLTSNPQSSNSTTLIEVEPDVTVKLSNHIVNCDYFINCPVLKDHNQSDKRWTLAFKNHIGSVYPSTCHTPNPRLLNISASSHLKEKTRLLVLSGIHGVYTGGPGGGPQPWNLFPEEHRPNLIMVSTDPVSLEHWGIELINQERPLHGLPVYNLSYCEDAAGFPWNLGIYDFSQHELVTSLPAPSSLAATREGENGVLLQWTEVSGATKYRVYRSTDPNFTPDPWDGTNLLAETTTTSYSDPSGAGNPVQNNYYVVRAFRAIFESSDSPRVGAFDFSTSAPTG
jgi:uncharacterized protein (DUF362 family)